MRIYMYSGPGSPMAEQTEPGERITTFTYHISGRPAIRDPLTGERVHSYEGVGHVVIEGRAVERVLAHCSAGQPQETCGLFGGMGEHILTAHPVETDASDAGRSDQYLVIQHAALDRFRENHLEFMGVYHSHPGGSRTPSSADLSALQGLGQLVCCIVTFDAESPQLSWFLVSEGEFHGIEVEVIG